MDLHFHLDGYNVSVESQIEPSNIVQAKPCVLIVWVQMPYVSSQLNN